MKTRFCLTEAILKLIQPVLFQNKKKMTMLWEQRESWPGILITIGTVGLYDPSGTQAIWPVDRILQWYKMSDAQPIFLDTGPKFELKAFILGIVCQTKVFSIQKTFISEYILLIYFSYICLFWNRTDTVIYSYL